MGIWFFIFVIVACFAMMLHTTIGVAIRAFRGGRKIIGWGFAITAMLVILMFLVILFNKTSPFQVWLNMPT